ncbi:MAG: hypothetical protein WBY44_25585 [Bryobacteraceae bacterium]
MAEPISQRCDVLTPKGSGAMFTHSGAVRLLAMHVSLPRVLQSLPGALVPSLVILFLRSFRGAAVSVSGYLVQFGGSLVILVMRSLVISSGHLKAHDLS